MLGGEVCGAGGGGNGCVIGVETYGVGVVGVSIFGEGTMKFGLGMRIGCIGGSASDTDSRGTDVAPVVGLAVGAGTGMADMTTLGIEISGTGITGIDESRRRLRAFR